MAQPFFHGVETVQIQKGPRPVNEVKTAVIGLVGIAPHGPVNVPVLVKNDVDAVQFGDMLPGFDIPQALNFIFGHNAGTVVVVNVFDEVAHTTAVVDEAKQVAAGKIKLEFVPVGAVTLKDAAGDPSVYVKGEDYTLDAFGNFAVIAGRIADGVTIKFDYKKLNAAAVNDAAILGAVGVDGNRTGIKALDLASTLFGFAPKVLLVPGRSGTKVIADEMLSLAERVKGVALIDSTPGDTVAQAIAARGDATKAFGTSSKRAILCFPYLKGFDPYTNGPVNYPFSMFLAGLIAWTDNNFGYWFSASNKPFKGVLGVERPISANMSDPDTDANALNEVGITTVFNAFGTGFLAWGNRNASFPTNTASDSFISLLRTFDVLDESLQISAMQFVDFPITNALIDDIRQSGNDFVSILVGRGALTQGTKVVFDRSKNSNEQLSAGQLTFTTAKDGPSPAERITHESLIDISLKSKAIS
jgi:phage tail sheath protein FI